jgi:hypothetical protein
MTALAAAMTSHRFPKLLTKDAGRIAANIAKLIGVNTSLTKTPHRCRGTTTRRGAPP